TTAAWIVSATKTPFKTSICSLSFRPLLSQRECRGKESNLPEAPSSAIRLWYVRLVLVCEMVVARATVAIRPVDPVAIDGPKRLVTVLAHTIREAHVLSLSLSRCALSRCDVRQATGTTNTSQPISQDFSKNMR